MPLQQLFTSRKVYDADTFVAQDGKLFYDEATGYLRLGDGTTPGGKIVMNLAIASTGTTAPINPYDGELWYNPTTKELWAYHNGSFRGTINQATTSTLGGIRLGPGVSINSEGQIIIDSTGLDFSFGNFAALTGIYPADYYETERQNQEYAILSSLNTNEDVVVASNGTGAVRVVGDFSVRRANGSTAGALLEESVFRVKSDGQVTMLVPGADTAEGAVNIVGGLDGVFQPPINNGVMLHVTGIAGTPGVPSRIYNDAQNAFAAFVARRYNGTAASPSAVLDGEEIMRISGTAHDGTVIPGAGNTRILYRVLGDQTLTNHGGAIEFWTTPLNTTTLTKVATINNADGITATKFTGPLSGNVSATTITATNIIVTGNVSGNVSSTNITASSITATNVSVTTGTVGSLTIGPGTTSTAALRFSTGTILTTPVSGAIAYDGKVFYGTPIDNERGLISTDQYLLLNDDRVLVNDLNPQSMFGYGFHLSPGMRYRYHILATVTKTSGNGVTIGYGFTNTNGIVLGKHIYRAASTIGADALTPTAAYTMKNSVTSNFQIPVAITPSLTNGASGSAFDIQGVIEVSSASSNTGYVTPQITFLGAAPSGALLLGGATIRVFPVGSTGTNTIIGNWA